VPGLQGGVHQLVPAASSLIKLPAFANQDPQEAIFAAERAGTHRSQVTMKRPMPVFYDPGKVKCSN